MDPLAKRLGLHQEMAGLLLGVPEELRAMLAVPPGTSVTTSPEGLYGFVLGFVDTPESLTLVAKTALEHALSTATVWLVHRRSAVQIAAGFQSPEFDALLRAHRRKKRSQIRIGRSERDAEWLGIRFSHY